MNELAAYRTELDESERWFLRARAAALAGDRAMADECLARGLDVLDSVEEKVINARGKE